jgi:hypothetical protein
LGTLPQYLATKFFSFLEKAVRLPQMTAGATSFVVRIESGWRYHPLDLALSRFDLIKNSGRLTCLDPLNRMIEGDNQ